MARSKTTTKTTPRPRPQRSQVARKEEMVPIRMTTEQKETLAAYARASGMGLSTWLLHLGLKAVKEG
jgi:hypothetical protein